MLLIIAGIVLLIWWAVRQGSSGRHNLPAPGVRLSSSKALGILNERYAKGEIDKEEYEQRKQALSKE
ncbi:MAG: hypothetical protein A2074_03660 [Candidatus Aquicultor primus]|uniref:SHOCT domain-containing protein n=1 Tax=Candidatus Aquicultor primus TaxID=1797195 RepID=A0A1F2UHE3_9ACTN|nr:MAG: hypothetical protein A2074_03660 [Candidatus Aquicultor primus]HCG99315.1 hypothetical protein [Actinomycetota bacterium]